MVEIQLGEPVVRLEELPHVSPGRAKGRLRQLQRLEPAVAAVAALAKHEAGVAEVLDSELAVVRQPAVERRGIRVGPVEEIAVPQRRGLERIVRRGVQQERVAARTFEPLPETRGRVVRFERPGDQDRGERTRRERTRGATDDELRHCVAAQAAVAEQVRALGRHDVRRVGHDEVELLALDGLEEAAGPHLDVGGVVERRVERRVGKCPRVHVGRDHVVRVSGEQDRLDAVPVQRSRARSFSPRTVRWARATDGRCTPGT